ncbi:MAG: hypothetical protein ACLVBS_11015 [Agathobacter rectalis]
MTENEAIKIIKEKVCNNRYIPQLCNDGCMYSVEKCAFSMAINALQEVQLYRTSEAVARRENAMRKQQAAAPVFIGEITNALCPECGKRVSTQYCSNCGQKIKW